MSSFRDEAHLEYILECIALLPQHFAFLSDGQKWHENPTVRPAVLYTLQTMCESCQKLSAEAKAKIPQIDWVRIGDFRNALAHEYLGDLDYTRIDNVIHKHLPELKEAAHQLYEDLYG